MTERKLSGKTAIVTGSSRGIGRAIAERLGRDGASVAVTYHGNREKAEEAVKTIESYGSKAVALQVDVRDLASVSTLFRDAKEHFGKIDILVNNAAGFNVFKPTAEMSEAEYDSMFLITRGVYFAMQTAAKELAEGGRIVSTSTGGTAMTMAGAGAYTGSKAAIEQFSAALAKELGSRQITVNCVSPGATDTDGLVLPQAAIDQMIEQTPLGRLGKPEDIADVVAFLCSDDARWITGQNIRVTGGII